MSTRIKYILRAPIGATETIIDGHPYEPDEDGIVETYVERHRDVMVQHGYALVGEESVQRTARKSAVVTPIDIDECSRVQLAQELELRGVAYPSTASRGELAKLAEAWNETKTAPVQPAPAPERFPAQTFEQPPTTAQPQEQQTHGLKLAPVVDGIQDFDALSATDLKGWLSARGVAFAGNASQPVLAKAAKDYAAAMGQKTAEAEAV